MFWGSVWLRCQVQVALLLMSVNAAATTTTFSFPPPPSLSRHSFFSFSPSFPLMWNRAQTGERRAVVKRSSHSFGSFYRLMQRHARYLDEQTFMDKMFRLFDMNSDDVIERDEFRAIMQLMGLISHSQHPLVQHDHVTH